MFHICFPILVGKMHNASELKKTQNQTTKQQQNNPKKPATIAAAEYLTFSPKMYIPALVLNNQIILRGSYQHHIKKQEGSLLPIFRSAPTTC